MYLDHCTASHRPKPAAFVPSSAAFHALGPYQYLELLRKAKAAVRVPIIASLNGTTPGGWTEYGKSSMQEAGADALELNIYRIVTDADVSSAQIEQQVVDIVKRGESRGVHSCCREALAVFASLSHLGRELRLPVR